MSESLTRAEALRIGLCRGCRRFMVPGNGPAVQVCGNGDERCPGRQPHPARETRKEER